MPTDRPLRLAVVAGEESGDLLAADLVRALNDRLGVRVELLGVGGAHLETLGLRSLFDPAEIALVGFGAVLAGLPRILRRIDFVSRALAAAKPDALLTVDVPDFALRVARRVRNAVPNLPTVHYVCPSVWAWRTGRAAAMRGFIDHVLCLLPFEPDALRRLGGPDATYVGHRLIHDPDLTAAAQAQQARAGVASERPLLLLLPGSRRSEVARLLPDFRATLAAMAERGAMPQLALPTPPRLAPSVRAEVSSWPWPVSVTDDAGSKWRAFGEAQAALIASGTVSLELALTGVPHISCYRLDPVSRPFKFLIKAWSASLPNLISDRPLVPEHIDDMIRPAYIARQLEALMADTDLRGWQTEGFGVVRRLMRTDTPAGQAGADILLARIAERATIGANGSGVG